MSLFKLRGKITEISKIKWSLPGEIIAVWF